MSNTTTTTPETIDCLFIGHNEMDFAEYEKTLRRMGVQSGAYRDLNLNFIRYNNRAYHVSEVFNLFSGAGAGSPIKPFSMLESFSTAISYLGTYLHRRGFSFDYINSFQDEKDLLEEKLRQNTYRVIAVTTTLYLSVFPILEVMEVIRRHNRGARIVVGGPFVATQVRTLAPPDLMHMLQNVIGADVYVNSSQGETTLVNILSALRDGRDLGSVHNIYYKTPGGYAAAPTAPENNQLSDNPVDWNLFSGKVTEIANLRTAVSCPFSCRFCRYPEHAGKFQVMDTAALQTELDALAALPEVKSLYFIDDTFNFPVERFKEVLRMMIENRYPFTWHSYLRCQFVDRETVELMKESGCEGVYIGIESGSDLILKNMNKGATVKKYREGIDLLKEYGITTFGSFIIGFPGETEETAAETVRFIEESGLDFYRAHLYYFESVAPMRREREKFGLEGDSYEWRHHGMDSKTAADIVDQILLDHGKPGDPVWIPQYNFNFDNLWHLVHRGIRLGQVRDFLRAFNDGIREGLRNPDQKETGFEIINRLTEVCRDINQNFGETEPERQIIAKDDIEFDF